MMSNLNTSFDAEEVANIQNLLADGISSRKVTSTGIDYQKQRFIHLANKIFKFNGWSYSVGKENIDFVEYNDNTYKVGVCAWVKVLLKDGSFREDVGYGFYESVLKGTAIQNARKLAGADALIETLKGLGNAFNYLSADEGISGPVNSSGVQGDSSSETQTDVQDPILEMGRPPPTRRRGRKRKSHILSSSYARKIHSELISEGEEPCENAVQSSPVHAMPNHNNEVLVANNSLQDCEKSENDGEHHSSKVALFQSASVQDESTSEAPADLPDFYRKVKKIPARGRRGRKRRGRTFSSFCCRRRRRASPYIPQEPRKEGEVIVTPSAQLETASDSPTIPTGCEELKSFQNGAETANIPQERDGSPASGSTNTADESPTDTSYVTMVSTDWRCETSACNAQTSNVESMYSVIRTGSSNQSCAVQLQRVDIAYMEDQNPSPNMVISQSSSLPYGICKTEALDLSSSSAPSSHVGYCVKSTTSKKVISSKTKKGILQLL